MNTVDVGRSAIVGYLLGTIPSALIAGRVVGGPDLRTQGSGNPGAANAALVLGPRAGFGVLVGDIAKGALAGRIGQRLAGPIGAQVASTAAVVGHCYPVWSGFRGGKGVATSVGQVLSTFPAYFPIDLAVAVGTAALPGWRRRAFAASTASSLAWIGGSALWWKRSLPNLWGPTPSAALPVGAAVSSIVIFSRFWSSRPGRS